MRKAARKFPKAIKFVRLGPTALVALLALLLTACSELQQPKVEPFFAQTVPPPKQELRWSNGKTPRSLDPAKASAAPETDIVRAAYEGLTDLDSKSLHEIPGVAEKWESSDDLKTWTFTLRKDARWSNNERVTATDFVASWKRLAALQDKLSTAYLFQNIVGMEAKTETDNGAPTDFLQAVPSENTVSGEMIRSAEIVPKTQMAIPQPTAKPAETPQAPVVKATPATPQFGVEALDDLTLKISLVLPDRDFPKLVANPIFRPVYQGTAGDEGPRIDPATVTNGAFKITKVAEDGISMERSETYWNRKAIALERVRFVAASSAENPLNAYKKGEVDVITNASFEPLALKLLTPYEDFRRTAHSALNFYEFNETKAPYNDRRVREALAVAIDRAKLTDGDLEGMNQPAYSFFPLGETRKEPLALDTAKAKQLLEKAGFPNGEGFPRIRLVINRNDVQQRVARSVARMWKQNLNLDTVITVKESSEIDEIKKSGEYDLLRRGVVLPANDELVNIESVLGSAEKTQIEKTPAEIKAEAESLLEEKRLSDPGTSPEGGPFDLNDTEPPVEKPEGSPILSEADVVYELKVIPLYFPTSYSLVKPYIRGFEMNALDAHSLKEVSIDNNWQPRSGR
ncbi:MAG TPA: peptide ABC transporter substrate-binding protein [Pyrinomonadaceae bacterium]|nr:peptide ABC transporter substrate-binding protein [Pyrinomonadaceae bacterium]